MDRRTFLKTSGIMIASPFVNKSIAFMMMGKTTPQVSGGATCTSILAGNTDDLSSNTSMGTGTTWKAIKMLATDTVGGTAVCLRVRIFGDNGASSDNFGYAIYSHDAGNDRPGTVLDSSYVTGYNWTTIGAGVHEFQLTTTTNIVAATNYWWCFYTSGGVLIEATSVGATGYLYKYTATGQSYTSPPAGSAYTNSLADMIRAAAIVGSL